MCLVYLVCYFQSCEQQEKSNLVPILGALPDGHSLLYEKIQGADSITLLRTSTPRKGPCNKGTGGGTC